MRRILLALAVSASGLPALAAGPDSVSCADFVGLDDAGKAEVIAPPADGMMAAGGMMAATDPEGDPVSEATAACVAYPDLTVGAAMQKMP